VEVLSIYRKLSSLNPDIYLPNVALTLNSLASIHGNLNRFAETEKEYTESLDIFQNLYKVNPDAYQLCVLSNLGGLSYTRLLIKEFEKAVLAVTEAINLCKEKNIQEDKYSWIYRNLAHALLFQNKFDEAKSIYLKWKDAQYPQDKTKTFKYYFLQDFDLLEKAGITHPDIEKIRELLK
jgi:tetratricopeptide (TPR) repeat protein